MRQSRWASVAIAVAGLLFSFTVKNINEIWGWLTMSMGVGMLVPMLVRWFWWRMNGFGFAFGAALGMLAAVAQRLLFPGWPEYYSLMLVASVALLSLVGASLLTAPTEEQVLYEFYRRTRPFGFWAPIRRRFPTSLLARVDQENRRDIRTAFLAVPWQACLFLLWLMLVLRSWGAFSFLLVAVSALSTALYFSWFRYLGKEVQTEEVAART